MSESRLVWVRRQLPTAERHPDETERGPRSAGAQLARWLSPARTVLRPYNRILRISGALRLAGAALIAGLGLGYAPLGFVLFVVGTTGSYATAGGVLAAYAIGRAAATPPQGRLIDRVGPH